MILSRYIDRRGFQVVDFSESQQCLNVRYEGRFVIRASARSLLTGAGWAVANLGNGPQTFPDRTVLPDHAELGAVDVRKL